MVEPWYRSAFGRHYTEVYAHRNGEEARQHLPQIEHLARLNENTGAILDCGCGTGRYTHLLRERGQIVHGLDFSDALLAEARKENNGRGGWVRGNMLHLPFGSSFSRVLSLFTSFGYFDDDHQNHRTLEGMAKCLQVEGLLYLDYLNARLVQPSDWVENQRGKWTIRSRKQISKEHRQVVKDVEVYCAGEIHERYQEKVKLYDQAWFGGEFEKCGLDLLSTYGDYGGAPFADDSPRLIFVAIKRQEPNRVRI